MPSLKHSLAGLGLLAAVSMAQASVTVTSVTASNINFSGSTALLTDGNFPVNGTLWNDASNLHWQGGAGSGGTVFTLAFDQLYTLQGVTLTVDNNDHYRVQVSQDGTTWHTLFTLLDYEGNNYAGVENFTSSATPAPGTDYSESIDFAPTLAKYARIYALGGDGNYAVGELSFTGVPAVPEPGSVALIAAGLATVGLIARRRKQA